MTKSKMKERRNTVHIYKATMAYDPSFVKDGDQLKLRKGDLLESEGTDMGKGWWLGTYSARMCCITTEYTCNPHYHAALRLSGQRKGCFYMHRETNKLP